MLLWIRGFVGDLLANMLAGLVAPSTMIGIAFVVGWAAISAILWHRRQRSEDKPGMASGWFILLCFAVALAAVGGGAYGLALRSFQSDVGGTATAKPLAPSEQSFVSNQNVSFSYVFDASRDPIAALNYSAKFSAIGERLQLFVDVASHISMNPTFGSRRIKITEFKDFVRGQTVFTSLMTRYGKDSQGRWIIRWGLNDKDGALVEIGKMPVRVALIDNKGVEQHYYFMIVPAIINNEQYLDVITSDQLRFADLWEQQDAKK